MYLPLQGVFGRKGFDHLRQIDVGHVLSAEDGHDEDLFEEAKTRLKSVEELKSAAQGEGPAAAVKLALGVACKAWYGKEEALKAYYEEALKLDQSRS